MKRIILLAGALITLGLQAQAQQATFNHSTGGDTVRGYVNTGTLDMHNKIVNISNNPITIRWRVSSYDISNGWTVEGLCDNQTCYTATDILGGQPQTTLPIAVAGNSDMKVTFGATNALINTSAYLTVSETDLASTYNKTNTFIAYKVAAGVVTVVQSNDQVTLFPNPVTGDVLNVVYNPSLKVKTIGVYNVIGKLVAVYKTSDNASAKLTEINKLSSGVYFLRLSNAEGQVVATKKFTNQ